MNKYEEYVNSLQEDIDCGLVLYEDALILNDIAYENYMTEGLKEKVVDGFNKFSDSYVSGANKRAEGVAKAVLRKPKEDDHPHIVEAYKRRFNKIKQAYKVGELLTIEVASLFVPMTTGTFTAAAVQGYKNSKDPTDEKMATLLKNAESKTKEVFSKVKNLFTANKGKPVTKEFDNNIKKLEAEGLNYIKNIESKLEPIKPVPVKVRANSSQVTEALQDLLFTDDGVIVENCFDVIDNYIIETEYDDESVDVINWYINLM